MKRYTNRTLQGPESVAAAQVLRDEERARRRWPYPWSYPPVDAIRVTAGADASGSLVVPVAATVSQGLIYTVDEGFQFALVALVVQYLKAGSIGAANPGDFTWSLTVNQPVGVFTYQGSPVQGFGFVDVPLGTLQIPWPLESAEIFQPNDQLRVAFNNVNLTPGSPNYFKSILLGWKWPVE